MSIIIHVYLITPREDELFTFYKNNSEILDGFWVYFKKTGHAD